MAKIIMEKAFLPFIVAPKFVKSVLFLHQYFWTKTFFISTVRQKPLLFRPKTSLSTKIINFFGKNVATTSFLTNH